MILSELMASNQSGAKDADGDFSDWIELHNRGTDIVELTGWYLSDNSDMSPTWILPRMGISPGGYILLWCSGSQPDLLSCISTE